MNRRTIAASMIGAPIGALLGLLSMALVAARTLEGTVVVLDGEAGFVTGQAAMYLYVVVAGAVGGAILGLVGYGISAQDDSERFPAGPVVALSAFIGAVIAFASMRASAGLAGDIIEGVIYLPVFRAVVVAVISGASTGLIVSATVERLARRSALGLQGVAWPTSLGYFIRESAAAMGLPALGLVIGAAFVYGFSELLLGSDKTVALVLFGGVAALVLFGAALVAALPPRPRD